MKRSTFFSHFAFFWFGVLIYFVGIVTSFFGGIINIFKRKG
ncbi:MAG TPA: hypothetical protein PLO89_00500 [Spirochaetota bacterium]|nr:hypothetical protein [Spirochaetota bacterium]